MSTVYSDPADNQCPLITIKSKGGTIYFPGTTPKALAALCGVSLKTAKLWKTGIRRPSTSSIKLIVLFSNGQIMPSDKDWQPLRFHNGRLNHSNGETYNPSELGSLRLIQSMNGNFHRDLRALGKKLQQAEDYIQYLERQTPRAPVTEIKPENMRESLTAPHDDNPYFAKSPAKTRP